MESSVQASARHTSKITADKWLIRLSAEAHAHPNDAYARRAEAISTISSVLIDVPLRHEHITENAAYDGQISAAWHGEITGNVEELEVAREIISRLAAVPDVQIDGPHWSLSPEASASATEQALRGASATAKRTATTIAESMDGRLGKLLLASTESRSSTPQPVRAEMMATRSAAPPRTLDLELRPAEVEVSENISVTFEFLAN
ncbi:SIMPL domain-containing protein [Corynebacterium crudilactis]|uniref:SIMPL domain-containing protein n=1 Tax=Corynebacterium crudilactis TaxID=1652495 RepID=A0A172QR90_9CORY|nr:SIMPL domain-containing protein [Corynebacterium crudilactis]ANE03191.1 hypothetical protein ccrud_02520 [Corynebacterium crudilactis]